MLERETVPARASVETADMARKTLVIATRVLAGIVLSLTMSARGSSAGHPARHAEPYQIKIAIDRESLATEFYKSAGRFYVDATIRNISSTNQTITVWTNFGWSWVSDQPDIGPGTEALQNFPRQIVLKPRQAYRAPIEMISERHSKIPVTFRLGFVPDASRPASMNRQDYKDVAWSNFVTLP